MRLAARVTSKTHVLEEVIFKDDRKGDIKRAVAKLVRRFRKSKGGPKSFGDGTSISVVKAAEIRARPRDQARSRHR